MANENVVTADLKGGWSCVTTPLWQWDYGQVLEITGIDDLPSSFAAHCANRWDGSSQTVLGSNGRLSIPNDLLTSGEPVYVWIILTADGTDGETKYKITIPVNRRAAPTDYPTTAQQSAITQAINALNTAAANAAAEVAAELVDPTLAVSGKAADAAKTGEELSNLKSDYINSLISRFPKSEWSNGYFNSSGAFNSNSNYATPTATPFQITFGERILIDPSTYTVTVRIYNESGGAYSTRTVLALTSQQIIQFPTATYVSIHAFNGGSSINPLTCGVKIYNVNPLKVSVDSIGKSNNALIVGNNVFDASAFSNGGLSNGAFVSQMYNVSCYDTLLSFDYPITIKAKTGFKFGVHTFVNGTFSADSGWQTTYSIPANTTFKVVIARASENTSEIADINYFVNQLYFNSKIQYEINETKPSSYTYDVVGEPINLKRQAYDTSVIRNIIWPVTGVTNPQGFAIYNDVMFQFYSDDVVILSDFTDGTQIVKLAITSGHGDTVDFSKEFYNVSDEFPLIYSTADTTPCVVYVNRITRNSATLIRTYKFPDVAQTGYYAGHCLDADANVLYLVGYKENSYYQNPSGTNNMIVSSWNLDNCTTNSDETLKPTFIGSFEIPFIITVQGQRFFDNKLFLLSSNASGGIATNTIIYVVDPTRKKVVTKLESFPTQLKTYECQGIEFVENSECYDIVMSGYGKYYRLTFNR